MKKLMFLFLLFLACSKPKSPTTSTDGGVFDEPPPPPPQYFEVTQPTSSTIWYLGQQNVTIYWSTKSLGGDVQIDLWDGFLNKVRTISASTPNDGAYGTWDVPTDLTPGDNYNVYIGHIGGTEWDISAPFKIQSTK